MSEARTKRCVVAYATPEHQYLWSVDLPPQATVADALRIACNMAADAAVRSEEIQWDTASIGIFGEVCERETVPQDGDRIEVYRPLLSDPRERRRAKVKQERKARQV